MNVRTRIFIQHMLYSLPKPSLNLVGKCQGLSLLKTVYLYSNLFVHLAWVITAVLFLLYHYPCQGNVWTNLAFDGLFSGFMNGGGVGTHAQERAGQGVCAPVELSDWPPTSRLLPLLKNYSLHFETKRQDMQQCLSREMLIDHQLCNQGDPVNACLWLRIEPSCPTKWITCQTCKLTNRADPEIIKCSKLLGYHHNCHPVPAGTYMCVCTIVVYWFPSILQTLALCWIKRALF